MAEPDSWVVVVRNERAWLEEKGYGDATHELAHPEIGTQFVIIEVDPLGWLRVLPVREWLRRRIECAIWIHPEVVRPYRPSRTIYTLDNDTPTPFGCEESDLRRAIGIRRIAKKPDDVVNIAPACLARRWLVLLESIGSQPRIM